MKWSCWSSTEHRKSATSVSRVGIPNLDARQVRCRRHVFGATTSSLRDTHARHPLRPHVAALAIARRGFYPHADLFVAREWCPPYAVHTWLCTAHVVGVREDVFPGVPCGGRAHRFSTARDAAYVRSQAALASTPAGTCTWRLTPDTTAFSDAVTMLASTPAPKPVGESPTRTST